MNIVILPAFNEEKKIKRDIEKALLFFNKENIKGEIIISSNGTTDGTEKKVKKLQETHGNLLKLIEIKERIGKGGAIKEAVKKARGRYVMFADAGYCVSYKYIKTGLNILNEGYDIAIADRRHPLSIIEKRQFYRELGSEFFSYFCKYFLGIPKNLGDTQCGFKVFKSEVAKQLFKNLKTKDMMFDIEIILRAKKEGFRISSFPIEWKADKISKLHPVFVLFKSFNEIVFIKLIYGL